MPLHPCRPQRRVRSGISKFFCQDCWRRFVANHKKGPVSEGRKQLIRRLLLEWLNLRATAQATGVSRSWLRRFVNETYREETS